MKSISKELWDFNFYKEIILQILIAINYFHKNQIMHGDLNYNNILICPFKRKVKIIDFGCAKFQNDEKQLYSPKGNPKYRPPIKDFFCINNYKAECSSVGLILMSLVLKEKITTKFFCKNSKEIWERIQYLNLHANMISILKGLLINNESKRINIFQAIDLLETIN